FGTLLSSQGTDASFVPVSGPSGRFLRFRLYQTVSVPISSVLSRFFALAFPLSGGSDSIRIISAERIGFLIRIKSGVALRKFNFR
ncbi:hypothetical protein AB0G73_36630, partial [Streptomyces sp. NPDC020719]|uniref:hypothetical protein n=1 Tax=Streptomyces sp. NPDC020719 TaxID=3154896 RepID=UPI0033E475F3